MELHRLRAFAAVAREGGFSRAARKLGQTQSSVSQAVAALERELDESLLVRAGRRVDLTEAGRVLLAHAERAFAELAAAEGELAALRDLESGRLAVGTSDTLATWLLPPVLGAFRTRHPGVELRLDNR
ncbi:MAG TPA: LysR family transcriptional regulator, partial [Kofleriaceae bacterium]|nr:LysR family transcriptional regulator [Kofleriaceae bacterium]